MKEPLQHPGAQQEARFPRKVYYIPEEDGARMDELVRDATMMGEPGAYWAADEPYTMRPEPVQSFARYVFAAIRDSFATGVYSKARVVH